MQVTRACMRDCVSGYRPNDLALRQPRFEFQKWRPIYVDYIIFVIILHCLG